MYFATYTATSIYNFFANSWAGILNVVTNNGLGELDILIGHCVALGFEERI